MCLSIYLISSNSATISSHTNPTKITVKILPPCIGPDDTGFSEYIDTFDCLVDTLAEEPPSVITELSRQHNCERYVSTYRYSKSQQIIRDKGILFGGDAPKQYVVNAATNSLLGGNASSANINLVPPKGFGQKRSRNYWMLESSISLAIRR